LQINNIGFLTKNAPVKPIGYLTVLNVFAVSIFSQFIASKRAQIAELCDSVGFLASRYEFIYPFTLIILQIKKVLTSQAD